MDQHRISARYGKKNIRYSFLKFSISPTVHFKSLTSALLGTLTQVAVTWVKVPSKAGIEPGLAAR